MSSKGSGNYIMSDKNWRGIYIRHNQRDNHFICYNRNISKYPLCRNYKINYWNYSKCIHCKLTFCIECIAVLPISTNNESNTKYECVDCHEQHQLSQIVDTLQNSIHNIDNKILYLMAQYATGLVVECSNTTSCDREICFNNKFEAERYIDSKQREIYHYSPVRNASSLNMVYLYGKYRRIFCYGCTKYVIRTCQHNQCDVKDISLSKYICNNHISCYLCKYQPLSDWKLDECIKCDKYYCSDKCGSDQICKLCISLETKKEEQLFIVKLVKLLSNIVGDIMDINSIRIIAEYSTGHIIKCVNFRECNNSICIKKANIKNNIDIDGKYIYFYISRYGHKVYGKKRIIFCFECSAYNLKKCDWKYGDTKYCYRSCQNLVISNERFCKNHQNKCDICRFTVDHKVKKCIDSNCNNNVCKSCRENRICNDCHLPLTNIDQLIRIITTTQQFKGKKRINTLIAQYCMGYIVKSDAFKKYTMPIDNKNDLYNRSIVEYPIESKYFDDNMMVNNKYLSQKISKKFKIKQKKSRFNPKYKKWKKCRKNWCKECQTKECKFGNKKELKNLKKKHLKICKCKKRKNKTNKDIKRIELLSQNKVYPILNPFDHFNLYGGDIYLDKNASILNECYI